MLSSRLTSPPPPSTQIPLRQENRSAVEDDRCHEVAPHRLPPPALNISHTRADAPACPYSPTPLRSPSASPSSCPPPHAPPLSQSSCSSRPRCSPHLQRAPLLTATHGPRCSLLCHSCPHSHRHATWSNCGGVLRYHLCRRSHRLLQALLWLLLPSPLCIVQAASAATTRTAA
jgi:hypothetical protein